MSAPVKSTDEILRHSSSKTTSAAYGCKLNAIQRVGLLAKSLLLSGDREVQIVLLYTQIPTLDILDRVARSLRAHLKVIFYLVYFSYILKCYF